MLATVLLIAIPAAILALLIWVASRPADFAVSRAQTIAAPPGRIWPHLEDFRAWAAWSPWEGIDPEMRREFGGPASGVGATYHWTGDRRVGEGRMTIAEAVPGQRLGIDIEFLRPFAARNRVEFVLAASGDATIVTWTMRGRHRFMGKAFCLLMDMDRMVGGQFAKGLARLKAVSEAPAPG